MNIGTEGHVCFLVLEPRVIEVREVILARYPEGHALAGEPSTTDVEQVVDGTRPTGETRCEWGRVTAVDADGLLTVSGFASSGRPFAWRGVQVAPAPVPVTEPLREDPAGHAFHLVAECPWGR